MFGVIGQNLLNMLKPDKRQKSCMMGVKVKYAQGEEKKKKRCKIWGQPFLASLPHGSDQEGKKKENQSAGNAGKHLLPLEMNENRMPQNRHIVRGTCKLAGCSISCPTAIYLAVADWA